MNTVASNSPEVRNYLPSGYRKRSVIVSKIQGPYLASVGSSWDGGSKDSFTLIDEQGRHSDVSVPDSPFNGKPNTKLEVKSGQVLVSHGVFCGKPATAHITFVL